MLCIVCNSFAQVGYTETGKASYYGDAFHGKKTANGEKYNMYEFTAAHKTLAFGSVVKVINLDNGKEVTVRINDRGPFKPGRIIDLSKAAGAKVGLLNQGVANVSIEVISENTESTVVASTDKKEDEKKGNAVEDGLYALDGEKKKIQGYGLQVGSFTSWENAKKVGEKMKSLDFNDIFIQLISSAQKKTYRVLVGIYKSLDETKKDIQILKENGVNSFGKIYEK